MELYQLLTNEATNRGAKVVRDASHIFQNVREEIFDRHIGVIDEVSLWDKCRSFNPLTGQEDPIPGLNLEKLRQSYLKFDHRCRELMEKYLCGQVKYEQNLQ